MFRKLFRGKSVAGDRGGAAREEPNRPGQSHGLSEEPARPAPAPAPPVVRPSMERNASEPLPVNSPVAGGASALPRAPTQELPAVVEFAGVKGIPAPAGGPPAPPSPPRGAAVGGGPYRRQGMSGSLGRSPRPTVSSSLGHSPEYPGSPVLDTRGSTEPTESDGGRGTSPRTGTSGSTYEDELFALRARLATYEAAGNANTKKLRILKNRQRGGGGNNVEPTIPGAGGPGGPRFSATESVPSAGLGAVSEHGASVTASVPPFTGGGRGWGRESRLSSTGLGDERDAVDGEDAVSHPRSSITTGGSFRRSVSGSKDAKLKSPQRSFKETSRPASTLSDEHVREDVRTSATDASTDPAASGNVEELGRALERVRRERDAALEHARSLSQMNLSLSNVGSLAAQLEGSRSQVADLQRRLQHLQERQKTDTAAAVSAADDELAETKATYGALIARKNAQLIQYKEEIAALQRNLQDVRRGHVEELDTLQRAMLKQVEAESNATNDMRRLLTRKDRRIAHLEKQLEHQMEAMSEAGPNFDSAIGTPRSVMTDFTEHLDAESRGGSTTSRTSFWGGLFTGPGPGRPTSAAPNPAMSVASSTSRMRSGLSTGTSTPNEVGAVRGMRAMDKAFAKLAAAADSSLLNENEELKLSIAGQQEALSTLKAGLEAELLQQRASLRTVADRATGIQVETDAVDRRHRTIGRQLQRLLEAVSAFKAKLGEDGALDAERSKILDSYLTALGHMVEGTQILKSCMERLGRGNRSILKITGSGSWVPRPKRPGPPHTARGQKGQGGKLSPTAGAEVVTKTTSRASSELATVPEPGPMQLSKDEDGQESQPGSQRSAHHATSRDRRVSRDGRRTTDDHGELDDLPHPPQPSNKSRQPHTQELHAHARVHERHPQPSGRGGSPMDAMNGARSRQIRPSDAQNRQHVADSLNRQRMLDGNRRRSVPDPKPVSLVGGDAIATARIQRVDSERDVIGNGGAANDMKDRRTQGAAPSGDGNPDSPISLRGGTSLRPASNGFADGNSILDRSLAGQFDGHGARKATKQPTLTQMDSMDEDQTGSPRGRGFVVQPYHRGASSDGLEVGPSSNLNLNPGSRDLGPEETATPGMDGGVKQQTSRFGRRQLSNVSVASSVSTAAGPGGDGLAVRELEAMSDWSNVAFND